MHRTTAISLHNDGVGDDAPQSAVTWLSTHGKELVALVAAVAAALFGTAHAMFYGSLDVGAHDVGRGPVEVLSQAATGILTALAIFVILAGLCALLYRWSRGPECQWSEAVFAGGYSVLTVVLGSFGLAIVIVRLESSLAVAVGAIALTAGLIGLPLALGRLQPDTAPAESGTRTRVAAFVGFAFVIALVYLAGVTAVQDAGLVRRGVPPKGVLHSLAGGPAPCVTVTWLGVTLPANIPERAMHLGEANGRVVLYSPKDKGPVRVPASEVMTSPAGELDCKLP